MGSRAVVQISIVQCKTDIWPRSRWWHELTYMKHSSSLYIVPNSSNIVYAIVYYRVEGASSNFDNSFGCHGNVVKKWRPNVKRYVYVNRTHKD